MKDTIRPETKRPCHKVRCKVGSVTQQSGPASKARSVKDTLPAWYVEYYRQRAMKTITRNEEERNYRRNIRAIPKGVCPTIKQ